MQPTEVLLKPIISEKSSDLRDIKGVYVFHVRVAATKYDIKKAIKQVFNVNVKSVKTLRQHGKVCRRGNKMSAPKLTKKAFVTLAAGEKIKIFDDQ